MTKAIPGARAVLTVTVRLRDKDKNPLEISFESYPDIFDDKVIGPTVSTIDEACSRLRVWLEEFNRRHDDSSVTRQ